MLSLLMHPIFIFWLLLVAAGLLFLLKHPRFSRGLVFAALTWLFITSVSPFPVWLTRMLEKEYAVLDTGSISNAKDIHIVVLGGGYSFSPDLPASGQLSPTALSRLIEAVRIHRLLPGSKIVCSGSTGSENSPQAVITARAAIDLGVSATDTLMIVTPRQTSDEARDYFRRFAHQYQVVLVTSAVHMPRAVRYFEENGIHPLAAPTDHYVKIDPDKSVYNFKPSVSKIEMMEGALHELAGLLEFEWMTD